MLECLEKVSSDIFDMMKPLPCNLQFVEGIL